MDEVENKTAELNQALELLSQSYDDTLEAFGSALDLKDMKTASLPSASLRTPSPLRRPFLFLRSI